MLLKEIYIILTHIITNSIFNFPDKLKMADMTQLSKQMIYFTMNVLSVPKHLTTPYQGYTHYLFL